MTTPDEATRGGDPRAAATPDALAQSDNEPATFEDLRVGAAFAIPALDGSSGEELARLDRAFDAALAARGLGG